MLLTTHELKSIEGFLKDYKTELTGSFIAKKNNLNQKTVSNILNKLEDENILKSRLQGKNKLYSLNFENKELITQFILAIEHLRTINFYKENILVKEVAMKIKEFINGSAIIFGSYAKGLQKKDSDIDILVIGRANEKEIDKISRIYNLNINLKIYPSIKKNDFLINEVIKDHIIIKNTEKFIEEILNG